eukprot:488213-Alexandrium_andersonii.AAC.1
MQAQACARFHRHACACMRVLAHPFACVRVLALACARLSALARAFLLFSLPSFCVSHALTRVAEFAWASFPRAWAGVLACAVWDSSSLQWSLCRYSLPGLRAFA